MSIPRVEIKWIDPQTLNGWFDDEDTQKEFENHKPAICESIGYLYKEDDNFIKIVRDKSEGRFGECFVIPNGCILEITYLEKKNEPINHDPAR